MTSSHVLCGISFHRVPKASVTSRPLLLSLWSNKQWCVYSSDQCISPLTNCFSVLYVIILSAALDLVPPSTPKGIIAFCNIAPSLVAKVGWPYLLKGRIRYAKRLAGCWLLSTLGMIVRICMFRLMDKDEPPIRS